MARIFDVIEYPNEMADELVHRFPDDNSIGHYRIGSQVIVREAQSAVDQRNRDTGTASQPSRDRTGAAQGLGLSGDRGLLRSRRQVASGHRFPDKRR